MITSEQLRAGRALLRMEQKILADLSGVSIETIKRLERLDGPIKAWSDTTDRLEEALTEQGVIFIPEGKGAREGVQLRLDPPPVIYSRTDRTRGVEAKPIEATTEKPKRGRAAKE